MYKLLQINSTANVGSTGRIAENIGRYVISKGWKSIIAYGRSSLESQSNLIKIGNKFSLYTHFLLTRFFDKHGFGSKYSTIKFVKIIEKEKPDIIHLHNIHGYYINIKILFDFLDKSNIPIVWTLHDCWPFTGHCAYFDFINCQKWQNLCHKCPNKTEYPSSFIFDNSKNNFLIKKKLFTKLKNLTIITPSFWLKNLVEKSFLNIYNCDVIYNGIDLKRFKRVNFDDILIKYRLKKPLVLGCASIWSKRKGLEDIVEIAKVLDNFNFVVIGVNKKQKNKYKLKNLTLIEKTENIDELIKFYSAADVFINPTYEDNFPTTNIEALACGTPVITYNTGGSPEALTDDTGIIVEKGNINEIIKAINYIVENKNNKFNVSQCLKRAQFFDMNDKYEEYYKLYMKILNLNF